MKNAATRVYLVGTLAALLFFLVPLFAQAHEAYVIDHDVFWQELSKPVSPHAFDALRTPNNVRVTIFVVGGTLVLLTLNFAFRLTTAGQAMGRFFERYARFGPIFVRAAIAAAFMVSAASHSFLGPELTLDSFSYPAVAQAILFLIGLLIAIGFVTEIAAVLGLTLFAAAYRVFGSYVFTYTNYLGELIVLFLFGMRRWSVDARLFGHLSRWRLHFERYETTIVRIGYGFALIFAGLTVKFLHPDLTIKVAIDWHLTQFHWLFPSDPLLITFGAGLAEIVIGLFIIIGFEMRLTVLISLFYITMSLLYFRELVWPHYMLYGISLNLLVQPEVFTLDHVLFSHHRRRQRWWLRPFLPHHAPGKSTGLKLRPSRSFY